MTCSCISIARQSLWRTRPLPHQDSMPLPHQTTPYVAVPTSPYIYGEPDYCHTRTWNSCHTKTWNQCHIRAQTPHAILQGYHYKIRSIQHTWYTINPSCKIQNMHYLRIHNILQVRFVKSTNPFTWYHKNNQHFTKSKVTCTIMPKCILTYCVFVMHVCCNTLYVYTINTLDVYNTNTSILAPRLQEKNKFYVQSHSFKYVQINAYKIAMIIQHLITETFYAKIKYWNI